MPVQEPSLTVRAVRAVPVKVPMTYTLGTSAAIVREAPLLLVSLETEEGVTGHAWQFCYTPAAAAAIEAAAKAAAVSPAKSEPGKQFSSIFIPILKDNKIKATRI